MHGASDQTGLGRDGGTKKVKEQNETLDDLEHNEDGRGCCYQPLLKTYPEAADRSPSSIANVLRDLMRGGQQELRTGIDSDQDPDLVQVRHWSGQVRFITRPKSRTMRVTRQLMLPPSTVT